MRTFRSSAQLSLAVLVLSVVGGSPVFGQSPVSSLKVVVETSTGRSYQQKGPSGWNAIYAGRNIDIGQTFVASSDASLQLAIGALRVEILPITIAAVTEVGGTAEHPRLSLRLGAGAVHVIQPRTSAAVTRIDCPFGSVSAIGSEFLVDGNRLSVARGKASVVNNSGNRRTVLAHEELIILPSGFLPLPTRSR